LHQPDAFRLRQRPHHRAREQRERHGEREDAAALEPFAEVSSIVVDATATTGPTSLRQAVSIASEGAIIRIRPGLYQESITITTLADQLITALREIIEHVLGRGWRHMARPVGRRGDHGPAEGAQRQRDLSEANAKEMRRLLEECSKRKK